MKSDGDQRPVHMCTDDHHRFILDSVATVHATGDPTVLELDHSADVTGIVFRRRDGKELPVLGAGSVVTVREDDGGFRLAGVQCVPELGPGFTLVSVQQLAASGFLVMFCGAFCYVADVSKGGSIVGKGTLHDDDGFYHLQFLRVPEREEDLVVQAGTMCGNLA